MEPETPKPDSQQPSEKVWPRDDTDPVQEQLKTEGEVGAQFPNKQREFRKLAKETNIRGKNPSGNRSA